jgi:hypothetical protein
MGFIDSGLPRRLHVLASGTAHLPAKGSTVVAAHTLILKPSELASNSARAFSAHAGNLAGGRC